MSILRAFSPTPAPTSGRSSLPTAVPGLASATASTTARGRLRLRRARKFSVSSALGATPAGRVLALLGAALLLPAAAAERYPITPQQREIAEEVAAKGVPLAELAANAPTRYTIKRGDTLWAIAALFLKSPWRWPELWGMNRAQVHNPHLIYPGQTLVLLNIADGRAQLVLDGSATPGAADNSAQSGNDKLSPRMRAVDGDNSPAISSIPNNAIEPFLSRPNVITPEDLARYPRIVAAQTDRVFLGIGDEAYARGVAESARVGAETYHVFRPAKPLFDPDDYERKSPIAYEAQYLGSARLIRGGEVATLLITESKQEIGVEDRLIPIVHQDLISYMPHRPEREVHGRIVSIYEGVFAAGAGNIITLNRGRKDGLDIGTVVTVLQDGKTIVDRTSANGEKVRLPDETVANAFVFRVFDGLAYALLVSTSGPVQVGDRFVHPDDAPAPLATDRHAASAPTP